MATDPFRPGRTYPAKTDVLSAGQLWRHVPVETRLAAARAFWSDGEAGPQQIEATAEMARRLKFRPQSVRSLPIDRKTRHLASLSSLSDAVAGQVLVTYHLATKRPMMASFLDALGVLHEQGVIANPQTLTAPDPSRLATAVKALIAAFPREDVSLYLSTLIVQDSETWAGLRPELESLSAQEPR